MHSIGIQIRSDRMVPAVTNRKFPKLLSKLIHRLARHFSAHRLGSEYWVDISKSKKNVIMQNMNDRKVDYCQHGNKPVAPNIQRSATNPIEHRRIYSLPCSAWCATISVCRASAGSCNCRWCFRNANCHRCRSTKLNCYSRCSVWMGRATTPATTVNSISAHTRQSLLIYCPDRFPA